MPGCVRNSRMRASFRLCCLSHSVVSTIRWLSTNSSSSHCSCCCFITGDMGAAQLLLAGFGEQLGAPRQTRLQRQRLQTVLDDSTHLDQLVTVTQHAQNLAALERWSMQPRKL